MGKKKTNKGQGQFIYIKRLDKGYIVSIDEKNDWALSTKEEVLKFIKDKLK